MSNKEEYIKQLERENECLKKKIEEILTPNDKNIVEYKNHIDIGSSKVYLSGENGDEYNLNVELATPESIRKWLLRGIINSAIQDGVIDFERESCIDKIKTSLGIKKKRYSLRVLFYKNNL